MEDEAAAALVERAADGDESAWQELWRLTEPFLGRLIAEPAFLGRVGQHIDDRRNIITDVMARLRAENFRRLRSYVHKRNESPSLKFSTWLRVVTKRVGIDYLRGHPNYVDRRREADASSPGRWVQPGTLPSASALGGERPPVTNRGAAQQVLSYAAESLPDDQREALERWVRTETYEEIANALKLDDPTAAERLVRAAIERLRRKFRE